MFQVKIYLSIWLHHPEFTIRTKVYDYTKFEGEELRRTAAEQIDYLEELEQIPITIEDGMDENDWDGWKLLLNVLVVTIGWWRLPS